LRRDVLAQSRWRDRRLLRLCARSAVSAAFTIWLSCHYPGGSLRDPGHAWVNIGGRGASAQSSAGGSLAATFACQPHRSIVQVRSARLELAGGWCPAVLSRPRRPPGADSPARLPRRTANQHLSRSRFVA
jgi:hypothetical protein